MIGRSRPVEHHPQARVTAPTSSMAVRGAELLARLELILGPLSVVDGVPRTQRGEIPQAALVGAARVVGAARATRARLLAMVALAISEAPPPPTPGRRRGPRGEPARPADAHEAAVLRRVARRLLAFVDAQDRVDAAIDTAPREEIRAVVAAAEVSWGHAVRAARAWDTDYGGGDDDQVS